MGTQGSITVYDEQGKDIANIVTQFDGHSLPEWVARFVSGKKLTNGISNDYDFNGMGDLAARLIAALKNQRYGRDVDEPVKPGNVYLYDTPYETDYHITLVYQGEGKKPKMTVSTPEWTDNYYDSTMLPDVGEQNVQMQGAETFGVENDPDFDKVKADRNKDGEISDWEQSVGNAVAKGIREHGGKTPKATSIAETTEKPFNPYSDEPSLDNFLRMINEASIKLKRKGDEVQLIIPNYERTQVQKRTQGMGELEELDSRRRRANLRSLHSNPNFLVRAGVAQFCTYFWRANKEKYGIRRCRKTKTDEHFTIVFNTSLEATSFVKIINKGTNAKEAIYQIETFEVGWADSNSRSAELGQVNTMRATQFSFDAESLDDYFDDDEWTKHENCGGNLIVEDVLYIECDKCGKGDYQAESFDAESLAPDKECPVCDESYNAVDEYGDQLCECLCAFCSDAKPITTVRGEWVCKTCKNEHDNEPEDWMGGETFNSYKVAPELSSYSKDELISSKAGPQGTATYDEMEYDPIAQDRLSAEGISHRRSFEHLYDEEPLWRNVDNLNERLVELGFGRYDYFKRYDDMNLKPSPSMAFHDPVWTDFWMDKGVSYSNLASVSRQEADLILANIKPNHRMQVKEIPWDDDKVRLSFPWTAEVTEEIVKNNSYGAESFASDEERRLKAFAKKIENEKKKLVKKAKRSDLCRCSCQHTESWFQKEVRKLKDSISDLDYYEQQKYQEMIRDFDNWADSQLGGVDLEHYAESFASETPSTLKSMGYDPIAQDRLSAEGISHRRSFEHLYDEEPLWRNVDNLNERLVELGFGRYDYFKRYDDMNLKPSPSMAFHDPVWTDFWMDKGVSYSNLASVSRQEADLILANIKPNHRMQVKEIPWDDDKVRLSFPWTAEVTEEIVKNNSYGAESFASETSSTLKSMGYVAGTIGVGYLIFNKFIKPMMDERLNQDN